ncbi:MAG: APC family permease [Steroidobacteraceae bacterium]
MNGDGNPGGLVPQGRLESLGYSQELHRGMSLGDVVVYGLIFMCPMAPVSVFGFIYNLSGGQVATVYIIAAVAMYFSAVSYCEMAKEFPVAGSVYSYVRFGAGEFAGFFSGWAILLDYLLLPALLFIFASAAMHLQIPAIPQWVWIPFFVCIATATNVAGIRFSSRTNLACLYIQLAVLAIFAAAAAVTIIQGRVHLSLNPLIGPDGFSISHTFAAIPIAALSYVGFDAISTLNEEAKGGGEAVARATMIVLFVVATLFVLQVYIAALFVPVGTKFDAAEADTAFYSASVLAVGPWFQVVITLTNAVIAMVANALVSQATTSRLIFSMARDRQLPRFLAVVDPKRKVPVRATIAVAVLSTGIGIVAVNKPDLVTSLVTFGSITAYSLLHIAVMRHFLSGRGGAHIFKHLISPIVGMIILGYALWSATTEAKWLAGSWLAIGLVIQWAAKMFIMSPRVASIPPSDPAA